MKTFRQKLLDCETLVGTHMSINDVSVAEIIGNTGFDYVWVDTEHSTIDYDHLQGILIAMRASGTPAIVRIPWNDPVLAKKVLELGPDGIIFPMIRSVEEARQAVASCLYPPDGTRGFGPRRAMKYGALPLDEYLSTYRDKLAIILQIEHIDAVNCIEDIIAESGADAYVIGPRDLAGSLNKLGNEGDPEVQAAFRKAIGSIRRAGKTAGLSVGASSDDAYRHWLDLGINMISSGADYWYITSGAKKMKECLDNIYKK